MTERAEGDRKVSFYLNDGLHGRPLHHFSFLQLLDSNFKTDQTETVELIRSERNEEAEEEAEGRLA